MSILWRPRARHAFLSAIEYLADRNEVASGRLKSAVELALARLERRPLVARPAGYPGCRAWSLTAWSKVIIFREIEDGIEIVAFLDTRERPPGEV